MYYVCDFIEDSADKVLLHPIDDQDTLAQQKFVAFEINIIVGPHTEIICFFQFISIYIYEYLKSFHADSNHRVYIDCESKVFLLYFNCFLMHLFSSAIFDDACRSTKFIQK